MSILPIRMKIQNHPSKFSYFNEFNRIKPKEKEFSGQKKEVPKETSPFRIFN